MTRQINFDIRESIVTLRLCDQIMRVNDSRYGITTVGNGFFLVVSSIIKVAFWIPQLLLMKKELYFFTFFVHDDNVWGSDLLNHRNVYGRLPTLPHFTKLATICKRT